MPFSELIAACCIISGQIHTPAGAPLANAHIVAIGPERKDTTSDASGHFSVQVLPGKYEIIAVSAGYDSADVGPVVVDRDTAVDVGLEPVDSPEVRTIATVSVNGRLALVRNEVPSVVVSRASMDRRGFDRVIDALAEVPSVTFAHPDGGNATTPVVAALRGPDPSESQITLDGQLLNDGNTGDIDLSRFPVAAFSALDVSEGLGPRDTEGSNTFGGAVNFVSLRPTATPHSALQLSGGSFGRTEGWLNDTGTSGRLGYAFALDDQQEGGFVHQTVPFLSASGGTPQPLALGSSIAGRTALANLQWQFSQRAGLSVRAFDLTNLRDESAAVNAPCDNAQVLAGVCLPSEQAAGDVLGVGAASFAQEVRAYQVRGEMPLGAGEFGAAVSLSDNAVTFTGGAPASPYDVNHSDRRGIASADWSRTFSGSEFAIGASTRNETLAQDGVNGALAQHVTNLYVRGGMHPTDRLRLDGGIYSTRYSTFGVSTDWRAGGTYDLDAQSVLRASVGTGFRAPLLIERYVVPLANLVPDQNCVLTGQGNPNEQPERSTEYELGYSRKLNYRATFDLSAYWTNLRDPIENFYPLGASCPGPTPPLQSFPINTANAVYKGAEARLVQQVGRLFVSASYGLNVAYPFGLPATVSNPTSGGALVDNQQFLGIPQQVGSLGLDWDHAGWHAALDTLVYGKNNGLNQGAYAMVDAGIGKSFGKFDLTLAATNLTNAVSGRFTQPLNGTAYRGVVGLNPDNSPVYGALPTDARFVEPLGIRLILTVRN